MRRVEQKRAHLVVRLEDATPLTNDRGYLVDDNVEVLSLSLLNMSIGHREDASEARREVGTTIPPQFQCDLLDG